MTNKEAKKWCRQKGVEIHHDGTKIRLDFLVSCTIEGVYGVRYSRTAHDFVTANSLVSAVKKAHKRMQPYKPKPQRDTKTQKKAPRP